VAAEFARRPEPAGQAHGAGLDANLGADAGSAIVEFVLVTTLLLILFLGIVQTGIVLHIRNTLAADAAEGARHGANLGVAESAGGDYAERLIAQSIPGRSDVQCDGVPAAAPDGTALVQVTCKVNVPLSLTLVGGSVNLTVTGHAIKEVP
jgi:Flp pilus assembly protein TadG